MKNFEIQHKLGSGSYGVIYKALNKSSRSICVLKQINLTRLNEKAKKNVSYVFDSGCKLSDHYG